MNLAELAVAEYGCAQDPWELAQLLDLLLAEVKPKLVLEIGSWHGGSLFAWGTTGADVIGYTMPETRDYLESGHKWGATVLYGNSRDEEAHGRITAALAGRPVDFAFIDGDHSYDGCASDLDLCKRLGARVIGIHDACSPGDPGVRRVWEQASTAARRAVLFRRNGDKPVGTGVLWP